MDEMGMSIYFVFFWFGFSITFVLKALLGVTINQETKESDSRLLVSSQVFLKILCMLLIFVGVWGASVLLGLFSNNYSYVNQFFIVGIAIGLVISHFYLKLIQRTRPS